jgi:hypothetical protein
MELSLSERLVAICPTTSGIRENIRDLREWGREEDEQSNSVPWHFLRGLVHPRRLAESLRQFRGGVRRSDYS